VRCNPGAATIPFANNLEKSSKTSQIYTKRTIAEVSKNLARYKFENNFVEPLKLLCRELKQFCKKF